MDNAIIILLVSGIIAGIACYLLRARRRGEVCIGCPCSKHCRKNCK